MKEKYDEIGKKYDLTRKADKFLTERLFHHLQITGSERCLDIGCGTGNYTIALNRKGLDFIGVEPSGEMLEKARNRDSNVQWKQGKAEDIPLEDNSVSGILAGLTIHHWNDLKKSFLELKRVLKPDGRLVMFTSTPKQMNGYWLNRYFPKMLEDSMRQMPSLQTVERNLAHAGFKIIETEPYFVKPELEDLFLYSGKHNPALYLEPQVRHGISSFSALANREEVRKGLKKLERDIESGEIRQIMENHENDKRGLPVYHCDGSSPNWLKSGTLSAPISKKDSISFKELLLI